MVWHHMLYHVNAYMEVKRQCELRQCKKFTTSYNHDASHGNIAAVRAPKRSTCAQWRHNFRWRYKHPKTPRQGGEHTTGGSSNAPHGFLFVRSLSASHTTTHMAQISVCFNRSLTGILLSADWTYMENSKGVLPFFFSFFFSFYLVLKPSGFLASLCFWGLTNYKKLI